MLHRLRIGGDDIQPLQLGEVVIRRQFERQPIGDFWLFRQQKGDKRAATWGNRWQGGDQFIGTALPGGRIGLRQVFTQMQVDFAKTMLKTQVGNIVTQGNSK
ncbi:Uncharacterised protein [Klebsiella oxytoca]|nr:Uncharacterised protein [Klebsiella oxytoca]